MDELMSELAKIADSILFIAALVLFLIAIADFRANNKQDSLVEILVAIFLLLLGKL